MAKRVLMVAFHYPPFRGSSGQHRTLSFSRCLSEHGWDPLILTANPHAYSERSDDQLGDIPPTVPVTRAFAMDTKRHLSLRGRYIGGLALPDPWVSWIVSAVPAGLWLIRKYRPRVLWSTYPIATAHLIGYVLHRLTGIPWVTDFRDPMTEVDPITQQTYPVDPRLWKARRWVERAAVANSTRAVFSTKGACQLYAERYRHLPSNRWAVIENGYDEDSFTDAAKMAKQRDIAGPIVLLHSGLLYPTPDRDPSALFQALSRLRRDGTLTPADVRVVLRATGHDTHYRTMIRCHGLEDMVILAPPIPYRNAIAEMMSAHGLLLFQGYTSNPAVPAKLYEYIRARRPIFAMVHPQGETAAVLTGANVGTIVPLDSQHHIADGLRKFLDDIRCDRAPIASEATVRRYSRKYRAEELARLFDALC